MNYIEAPTDCLSRRTAETRLFLAGGISGCVDWQSQLALMLVDSKLLIMNPRRKTGLEKTGEEAKNQIRWEHTHMLRADAISFWFPEETLCPIVLFELGRYLPCHFGMTPKRIFVGCHPNYQRKFDVEFQCSLERPKMVVVDSLDALAKQILEWENENKRTGETTS